MATSSRFLPRLTGCRVRARSAVGAIWQPCGRQPAGQGRQGRCLRTQGGSLRSCVSAKDTWSKVAVAVAAGLTERAELGTTLDAFVGQVYDERGGGKAAAMVRVFAALQTASKKIAAAAARAALTGISGLEGEEGGRADGTDAKKKLDVVANEIVKAELAASWQVAVMASEEDELPMATGTGSLAVVFDPLDGSRNIDVSIPTGTIFGIYSAAGAGSAQEAALRPGRELLAAGYALYSSATVMVVSLGGGSGTHGFTLDPLTGSYLLTHHGIRIPDRGQIYSLNDARYHDWPDGLQRYIDAVRQGKGESGKQYSARYVCSLVADFHRTLLYGGWCGNPRSHLRLVYEANPLSLLVEEAGGTGSDGQTRVLDLQPEKLHHRLPLFLGSPSDVKELLSYGDVQQTGAKKYTV